MTDERTLRRHVRVTATHRVSMLSVSGSFRVPCAACGHEVTAVAWEEAAALLRLPIEQLETLFAANRIHLIVAISGARWICRDSLFTTEGTT